MALPVGTRLLRATHSEREGHGRCDRSTTCLTTEEAYRLAADSAARRGVAAARRRRERGLGPRLRVATHPDARRRGVGAGRGAPGTTRGRWADPPLGPPTARLFPPLTGVRQRHFGLSGFFSPSGRRASSGSSPEKLPMPAPAERPGAAVAPVAAVAAHAAVGEAAVAAHAAVGLHPVG